MSDDDDEESEDFADPASASTLVKPEQSLQVALDFSSGQIHVDSGIPYKAYKCNDPPLIIFELRSWCLRVLSKDKRVHKIVEKREPSWALEFQALFPELGEAPTVIARGGCMGGSVRTARGDQSLAQCSPEFLAPFPLLWSAFIWAVSHHKRSPAAHLHAAVKCCLFCVKRCSSIAMLWNHRNCHFGTCRTFQICCPSVKFQ